MWGLESFLADDAVHPVAPQPHAEHADVTVSETDEVVGDLAHGSAVVDAHEGCTGNLAGLVADDDRNVTLEHGGKIRVVVGHGVDDKAVDARLLDHGCSIHLVAAGPAGMSSKPWPASSHDSERPARKLMAAGSRNE